MIHLRSYKNDNSVFFDNFFKSFYQKIFNEKLKYINLCCKIFVAYEFPANLQNFLENGDFVYLFFFDRHKTLKSLMLDMIYTLSSPEYTNAEYIMGFLKKILEIHLKSGVLFRLVNYTRERNIFDEKLLLYYMVTDLNNIFTVSQNPNEKFLITEFNNKTEDVFGISMTELILEIRGLHTINLYNIYINDDNNNIIYFTEYGMNKNFLHIYLNDTDLINNDSKYLNIRIEGGDYSFKKNKICLKHLKNFKINSTNGLSNKM
ncbi:uncharacterized protein VNE69_02231 [Vairimorpha necatrix]|uniref:PAS domain-containing protein n=1 Tax=Vairimorpha necatrix TaxID=6039 RepID=A0AAX4J9Q9_9MICR